MSPDIGEKDGAQEKNSQVVDFSGCGSDALPAVDEVSYPIFEGLVNQKAFEDSVIEGDPISDDLPVGEVSHPTSEGLVNQTAAEDSVVKDDPISDYQAEDTVAEGLKASEDPSAVSYRAVGFSGPDDAPRVDEENPVAESDNLTADDEVCPTAQGLVKQTAVEDSTVDDGSVSQGLTQAVIEEADDPTVNDDPRLVSEGVVNLPAVEELIVEVDEITNESIDQTVDELHTLDIGSSTEQTADQGSHAVSGQLIDQTAVENIVCDLLDLEIDLTVAAEEFTGNDLQAVAEENDGGAETITEIDNLLVAAEVFAEGELDGCAITEGEIAREDEKSRTGSECSTVVAAEVTQNLTAGKENFSVTGGIAEKNTEIFDACERPQNYDGATSLRKLKAAVREKVLDRSNLIYL